MKAVRNCEYGSPDMLMLDVVERPVPDDDQILVKVRANAINAADGHGLRGGYLPRLFGGLRKPKDTRFGIDYAGTVEAIGRNVTQFKPGDEVFGGRNGSMAEYVCARADRGVVLKPPITSASSKPRLCRWRQSLLCKVCATRGRSRPGRRF